MNKLAVICNNHSGQHSVEETLKEWAKGNDGIVMFALNEAETTEGLIRKISDNGFQKIVACGGDGTISSIVDQVLKINPEIKIGILPAGTFNHFAKDLKIPLNLAEAWQIILDGHTTHIDVARVNDTYFINNSSIGFYPMFVKERGKWMRRGWRKPLAALFSAATHFRKFSLINIEFKGEDKKIIKKSAFVFMGNNQYEISGLNLGKRERIDQGILFIALAHQAGRGQIVKYIFKAIFNLGKDESFEKIGLSECIIHQEPHKSLLVSYDGETKRIIGDIHYKIYPKALNVIVPQSSAN